MYPFGHESPHRGPGGGMSDYMTFVLWKAGVLCVLAFVWGVYCGATGRPLGREQTADQDARAARDALNPADRQTGTAR